MKNNDKVHQIRLQFTIYYNKTFLSADDVDYYKHRQVSEYENRACICQNDTNHST